MAKESNRAEIFSRRSALIVGGKFLLLAGLGGRLYSLQVLEADRYRGMAEDNRINLRLLEPTRGYIVDRYGVPLAINVQSYGVEIVPEQTKDLVATLDLLGRVIEISPEDRVRILAQAKKKRRRAFLPLAVRDNLDWEEVSRIEVNSPDLPGVGIRVGQARYYPLGGIMAHAVGYVGAVTEADLQDDPDPLLELPSVRIGKNGLERQYDLALRGKTGTAEVEVNAMGRVIQEFDDPSRKPVQGHDVVLTIDAELQKFIAARLAAERAAAVAVMEIATGDVLALVSTPGFDPNLFTNGISPADWQSLIGNAYAPLTNKTVAGQYAPGSTFKVAVMMAALEAGIGPSFTTHCSGYLEFGDRRFHCWKKYGHGTLDMLGGVRESCDVYFYELAQKVGMERIAAMATRLGLGAATGIDIPGERPGVIPTPDWKMAVLGQRWAAGETLVAGIGQGYVLATPLQLALMTARIASGKAVVPRLTRDAFHDDAVSARPADEFASLGIKDQWLKLVQKAMDQVINHEAGTARGSRLVNSAWTMAGKTGTAQVRRISQAERDTGVIKNDDLEWLRRDHALFISFAPVKEPRYSCAVVIEHGGSGSGAAAPVARDIMQELERREIQMAGGEGPAERGNA